MNKGKCYGVSVGPGAKDLITIEALELIKNADVIFLPTYPKEECRAYRIIKKSYDAIDEKELICESFSMSSDNKVSAKRHEEIFKRAKEYIDKEKTVAFLALGEAGLYSTYIYIHERLVEAGYESNIIPGISSVQEVCRRLNIPLAKGREEVHIFPDTDELTERLLLSGTKVFMKPKSDIADIASKLEAFVKDNPGTRAFGISNCGTDGEIIADEPSKLKDLNGYFTVIIVKDAAAKSDETERKTAASSEYFENRVCSYYPCHKGEQNINCLFCYCPMYNYEKCLGEPSYIERDGRKLKNCTGCSFPHKRENYGIIMEFLKKNNTGEK